MFYPKHKLSCSKQILNYPKHNLSNPKHNKENPDGFSQKKPSVSAGELCFFMNLLFKEFLLHLPPKTRY